MVDQMYRTVATELLIANREYHMVVIITMATMVVVITDLAGSGLGQDSEVLLDIGLAEVREGRTLHIISTLRQDGAHHRDGAVQLQLTTGLVQQQASLAVEVGSTQIMSMNSTRSQILLI